jgi:hypothetical protein
MRKTMKSLLAALGMAAAALFGAPAHAVLVQQTYTGSVVSGDDFEGAFGAAGADLAGQPFIAVFTFDTTRGNTTTGPISSGSGTFVQLAGGTSTSDPFLGAPTPLVSATLSVAGSSAVTVAAGLEDRTAVRSPTNPASVPSEYFASALGTQGDVLSVFVRSFSATYPADLTATGLYFASAGAVVGDQFRIVNAMTFTDRARGVLAPSMLVVSVVPEPATAFLMATGLAGVLLLKRRTGSQAPWQRAHRARSTVGLD